MKYLKRMLLGFFVVGILALAWNAFAADTFQACTEKDGTVTYTNKTDRKCTPVSLPKVTVAPTRTYLPPVVADAVITPPGVSSTVNDKMCDLYEEWMELSARTLGGFNRNTVKDTQRRLVLVQLFGGGFAPTSCR
jgi:hypothetical protein